MFATRLVIVSLVFSLTASFAHAQSGTGAIEGRVIDGVSGQPLPGATVLIEGSSLMASTDRNGSFRITGVEAGAKTLLVSYLGSKDAQVTITVRPGAVVSTADVKLDKVAYAETVTVTADFIRDADARALNQQKTAPNITNVISADQIGRFPDANAAETTQRIPGVSISKDQGDGRYVLVRGAEARLNSMMIDGERVPSPDPALRQVALDVIPSDLLQSIEVSKALTPDQDGDAIGGSVNLVMKQAPQTLRVFGAIGTGYNQMESSADQNSYSLTGGRRFNGGKAGAILSIGGSTNHRGNQDFEAAYDGGNLLDLDPRYYRVARGRVGVTGALDFKPGDASAFTVRGVFNRYIDDHENRQRLRLRVGNRRVERELRDRTHLEHINSLSVSGQHLASWAEVDWRLLGAYSDQDDPLTMTTTFRQSNVNFAPNVSPTSIDENNIQANPLNLDYTQSTFNQQIRATNFAKDRDIVGAINLRRALRTSGDVATVLKFGGKYRDKLKGRTRNEVTLTTASRLAFSDFIEEGADPPPYLDGRYTLLPFLSQSKVAQIPSQVPVTSTPNHARDAEEFDGTEVTAAGYAMAEIFAGSKLYILPGVRYEHTSSDYTGRQVLFSPTGAYLSTVPVSSKTNYGVVLPGLHVKYAFTPSTNLRAAVTRTLARPNYYDLVPYEARNDVDNTVSLGNTDLQPTTSWNVDFLGEHYFKSVGVVSAGVFYKHLQDYIYVFTFDRPINNTIYHYTQPLNGETASIHGVELALQNQLTFLPRPFDGLGIYLNYTFTDSDATFPQHVGGSTLPGQSRHVGNIAVSYEKAGFQGRMATTFHGSFVDVVGGTNLLDRFYDSAAQIDISLSQKIYKGIRIYADGLNLNDALLRYYQGVPNRPLQEEHYHWWIDFGLKFDF